MNLRKQLRLLNRLHLLIRRKATGTPGALARRLEVSERTIYNLINTLREFGAEIEYCRYRQSYVYATPIEFNFDPVLSKENLSSTEDGQTFFAHNVRTAKFLQWDGFTL